jgi:hypothetical protein
MVLKLPFNFTKAKKLPTKIHEVINGNYPQYTPDIKEKYS